MYVHFQHLALGENHRRMCSLTDDRAALVRCRQALVIAVADGAGSAVYGGCGAETAIHAVRSLVQSLRDSFEFRNSQRFVRRLFVQAREHVVRFARTAGHSVHDYATTLVVVVLSRRKVTAGRLGDGCVVVASPDGEIELLSASSRTGPTNVTEFLTDDDWQQRLVINRRKKRNLAVAAFTDGIEHQVICGQTKTPHAPFFQPVFRSLRTRGEIQAGIALQRVFETQIAQRSGDDMTIVVASPEDAR